MCFFEPISLSICKFVIISIMSVEDFVIMSAKNFSHAENYKNWKDMKSFRENYSKPTYGLIYFHFPYPWFKT